MVSIKLSTVKHMMLAFIIALIALIMVYGITRAQVDSPESISDVVIITEPIKIDQPIYVDTEGNGDDPSDIVATLDIYDGNKELKFEWPAYAFPSDVNGSYRIVLRQQLLNGQIVGIKAVHHWASGSLKEKYAYGSFGFGEEVCTTCPTYIVVLPEQVVPVINSVTGVTEYQYLPLAGASEIMSGQFALEIFRPESCRLADAAEVAEENEEDDDEDNDYFDPKPNDSDEDDDDDTIFGYDEAEYRCFAPSEKYQDYFLLDKRDCECKCYLTDSICQNEFGLSTADKKTCTCQP